MRRLKPSQGAVRRGLKNGRRRTQRTKGRASYSAFAEALMLTAHQAGEDNDATKDLVGYLSHIARLEPNLFLKLWAVIEQSANEGAEVLQADTPYETVQEAEAALRREGFTPTSCERPSVGRNENLGDRLMLRIALALGEWMNASG